MITRMTTPLIRNLNRYAAASCFLTVFLAVLSPSLAAQFSVTPTSVHFYGGGGNYQSVAVVVPSGVTWTATTSDYSWLAFAGGYAGASGTQSGPLYLNVRVNNSGSSRSATVTVTPSSGSPITVAVSEDVFIANTTPTVTQVSTLNTSIPGPASQTISVTFDDPNGPGYLNGMTVGLGYTSYDSSCNINYAPEYAQLYFASPTAGWQPVTLGQSGSLTSTWCEIDQSTSSVVFNGSSTTLNLALTLRPAAIGTFNLFAGAYDATATWSANAWTPIAGATWTLHQASSAPPSVTISNSNLRTQTVAVTVTDSNGYLYTTQGASP
jgi:hypothetical protein